MSEVFCDIFLEVLELQLIISGLFVEYVVCYGDYFFCDVEVELSEWYVLLQGLFIVFECEGEIIVIGVYKLKDCYIVEIKCIWMYCCLCQQGLVVKVVQELE